MDPTKGIVGARAYSIAQLTKIVPIGRSTIYQEIRAGRLRAVKLGGRTLFLVADLERWLRDLPLYRPGGAEGGDA